MAKQYDAIVIGGGIIGCSVAWRLAQTGRKVVLLERGLVGGEASSAAGGLLCPKAGPGVSAHVLRFWQTSHRMYPAFVEEVRVATGHVFECRAAGQLAAAFTDAEAEQLQASFRLQAPAGIQASWLTRTEALVAEPALATDVQAAIYFPDHILVDNGRLTTAVGWAVRRAGGDVMENRAVTGLIAEASQVTGVETPTGPVNAPVVVNCAGSWAGLIDRRAPQPIRPIKGQMLAVDRRPIRLEHIIQGTGGGCVPRADGRTLIGATHHDVGFDQDVIAGDISALFERVARMVPALRQARFLDAWAGLRPSTPDTEPLIGRDPDLDGLWWAAGPWTMGILMAPATAQAVAELIDTGRSSIPVEEFRADRFRAQV